MVCVLLTWLLGWSDRQLHDVDLDPHLVEPVLQLLDGCVSVLKLINDSFEVLVGEWFASLFSKAASWAIAHLLVVINVGQEVLFRPFHEGFSP